MRLSNYPTLETAIDSATTIAIRERKPIWIIADQPQDGGFALTQPYCAHPNGVYMIVTSCGDLMEGPAAMSLPIGFSGSLPIN